jgi:hypothetical protein
MSGTPKLNVAPIPKCTACNNPLIYWQGETEFGHIVHKDGQKDDYPLYGWCCGAKLVGTADYSGLLAYRQVPVSSKHK